MSKIYTIPLNKIFPTISSEEVRFMSKIDIKTQLQMTKFILEKSENANLTNEDINAAFIIQADYNPKKDIFYPSNVNAHIKTWIAGNLNKNEIPVKVVNITDQDSQLDLYWQESILPNYAKKEDVQNTQDNATSKDNDSLQDSILLEKNKVQPQLLNNEEDEQ
jgi:hypothetical protein